MAIIIPGGDPERARQALEQRRQREAEEAARRRLEVESAIAKGDVVQMATLWLDRRSNLVSDLCDECLRDMNMLTPELAHAANDEGLPYNSMLLVRTLRGSRSLSSAAPIIQLLSGAALQIENLRFYVEARQRAAKKGSLAPSPGGNPPAAGEPAQNMGAPAAEPPSQLPRISPDSLVTIQDIEIETGIPYSTLTSRRLRLEESDRPAPVGQDRKQRDLYRRGDWDKIVNAGKGAGGASSVADA